MPVGTHNGDVEDGGQLPQLQKLPAVGALLRGHGSAANRLAVQQHCDVAACTAPTASQRAELPCQRWLARPPQHAPSCAESPSCCSCGRSKHFRGVMMASTSRLRVAVVHAYRNLLIMCLKMPDVQVGWPSG